MLENLMEIRDHPAMPEIPRDFAEALQAAGLAAFFADCTAAHQREYLKWIGEAKRPATRSKRVQDIARLDNLLMPRCLRLTMWSTSQPAIRKISSMRQYSQRPPARARISRRKAWLIASAMP